MNANNDNAASVQEGSGGDNRAPAATSNNSGRRNENQERNGDRDDEGAPPTGPAGDFASTAAPPHRQKEQVRQLPLMQLLQQRLQQQHPNLGVASSSGGASGKSNSLADATTRNSIANISVLNPGANLNNSNFFFHHSSSMVSVPSVPANVLQQSHGAVAAAVAGVGAGVLPLPSALAEAALPPSFPLELLLPMNAYTNSSIFNGDPSALPALLLPSPAAAAAVDRDSAIDSPGVGAQEQQQQPVDEQVLIEAITTAPFSLQVVDPARGMLPLHLACSMDHPPLDIISQMIQLYPPALSVTSAHDGSTPLHYIVKARLTNSRGEDNDDSDADHPGSNNHNYNSQYCQKLLKIVHQMIDKYPEALTLENKLDSEVPLHIACEHNAAFSELIELMFYACPSALTMQNDAGASPLHVALRSGITNETALKIFHTRPLALMCFETLDSDIEQTPYGSAMEDGRDDLCELIYELLQHGIGAVMECAIDPACKMGPRLRSHIRRHAERIVRALSGQTLSKDASTSNTNSASHDANEDVLASMNGVGFLIHVVPKLTRELCMPMNIDPEMNGPLVSWIRQEENERLLTGIVHMNLSGRAYASTDPQNKEKGIKVLTSIIDNIDCLMIHLRENPHICSGAGSAGSGIGQSTSSAANGSSEGERGSSGRKRKSPA